MAGAFFWQNEDLGISIVRDLKHHLQDYVHLASPRKILTAGGSILNGSAKGVLQGLVIDDTATKSAFGFTSWWCPRSSAICSP